MKQSTTHNIVAFTCLVSFLATSLLLSKAHDFSSSDELKLVSKKVYYGDYRRPSEFIKQPKKVSVQEFDVVEAVRKQIEETEETTDGKIHKIRCTFSNPTKTVEAFYDATEKDSLVLVHRDSDNKKLSTQTVSFNG